VKVHNQIQSWNKAHLPPHFFPLKVQTRFDLVLDKKLLKLELPIDDYIRVFNELMGVRIYYFEYSRRPVPKIFLNS